MGAGGLVGDTAHIPDDVTAREAAPAGPITSTGSEISRDPPKDTFSSSQDSDGYPANFRGKYLCNFPATCRQRGTARRTSELAGSWLLRGLRR